MVHVDSIADILGYRFKDWNILDEVVIVGSRHFHTLGQNKELITVLHTYTYTLLQM